MQKKNMDFEHPMQEARNSPSFLFLTQVSALGRKWACFRKESVLRTEQARNERRANEKRLSAYSRSHP